MKICKVADIAFSLSTLYGYTEKLLSDYYCEGVPPEFSINITESDILREREVGGEFSDAYLESLAVYRKLCEKITADYNGFLIHCSAIAVDGEAYLFTAPSGTGKSTHASLWREVLGERAVMINDDKPIVRLIGGEFYAYGTPWDGKHRLSTNGRAKVKAVCKLYRSENNEISEISASEMLPTFLNQTLRPSDEKAMNKYLDLTEKFISSVGQYKLGCNISREAAKLAYETMSGKKVLL